MNQEYSGKRQNDMSDDFMVSPPAAGHNKKAHFNKREEKGEMRDSTHQDSSGSGAVSKSKLDGMFSKFPEVTPKTVRCLTEKGITSLFPIQQHCFKHIYANEDVIARDLTGSGKTLGFALPVVERLRKQGLLGSRKVQAIVLAPTRELACQVSNTFQYLKHDPNEFRCSTVYGGVPIEPQIRDLKNGIEIFVGTTGRVLDHIERGNIDFSSIKTIILDEADQMLKLGFKEDIERILRSVRKVQQSVQICLFSATVPAWIDDVAREHMKPSLKKVDLCQDLKNKTARKVQHLLVSCSFQRRLPVLADILTCYAATGKSIVFTQTKADANSLLLCSNIKQDVEVMHGDIAQNQREITLKRFREGKVRCLVATDVASRGLDIPSVDLVVQLEPPKEVETYIHRSGRTARAGASGVCVTFYNDKSEHWIHNIESQAGIKFTRIDPPSHDDVMKKTNKGMLQELDVVKDEVLPMFEDAAQTLLDQYKGNSLAAISKALAFIAGIHSKEGRSKQRQENDYNSGNFHPDPDYDQDGGNQGGGRFGGGGGSGRGRGQRGGGSGGRGGSNNFGGGGSCGSYRQSQATGQSNYHDQQQSSWGRPATSSFNHGARGGIQGNYSSSNSELSRQHTPGHSSGGSNRPHYYNQEYSGNKFGGQQQKPSSYQQRQQQDYPIY